MKKNNTRVYSRNKRHQRVRSTVKGIGDRPRLCVYRSNKYIYAALIDDSKGITLVSCSDLSIKRKGTKIEQAYLVGQEIAKAAKGKKVTKVVFDRGGYLYHGRVAKLAEGAREGGLKF